MKRILLPILVLLTACSPRHAQELRQPVTLACTEPAFLKPGDKVALISPSYYTPMENVEAAAKILRDWGFEPVVGANVGKIHRGHYAGTTKERLADLEWALADPSVKAILCNRGGYGTIRLVNRLSPRALAAHPKWLIGFSDITTLHAMETRSGVVSLHATMCSIMAKSRGRDLSSTLVRDILYGTIPVYETPAHPQNRPGRARGTLVGGNLCTFTPILGTDVDATLGDDIVLFIEEVGEDMSHIDRLVNTLLLNGVLDRCKGVILGEFTDCKANLDFGSVEEMIGSYLRDYDIPVLCGFPAGHGDVNLPLLMGATVDLDVTASGATLSFDVPGETRLVRTADALSDARPLEVGEEFLDADGKVRGVDGKWRDADGKWRDADGKWRGADGKWRGADGKLLDADGKPLKADDVDKPGKLIRYLDFLRHFEGIRR